MQRAGCGWDFLGLTLWKCFWCWKGIMHSYLGDFLSLDANIFKARKPLVLLIGTTWVFVEHLIWKQILLLCGLTYPNNVECILASKMAYKHQYLISDDETCMDNAVMWLWKQRVVEPEGYSLWYQHPRNHCTSTTLFFINKKCIFIHKSIFDMVLYNLSFFNNKKYWLFSAWEWLIKDRVIVSNMPRSI